MLCLLRCKSITTRETVKIAVTLRTGVLEDLFIVKMQHDCVSATEICTALRQHYICVDAGFRC